MTGFNGIFAGATPPLAHFNAERKISRLSLSEKRISSCGAAKVYLALLNADLFETFVQFKEIVFSSKEIYQKEVRVKYQKIYNDLLHLTKKPMAAKKSKTVITKQKQGKVGQVASSIFS